MQLTEAMDLAVQIARQGPAWDPNPQVGCVLLRRTESPDNFQFLASGWHSGQGSAHAEVSALDNARRAGHDLSGAIAVVSLEPCNHYGHTGPCSQALIESGICQVYYAVADPGAASGGGAQHLQTSGVKAHLLPHLGAKELIAPWLIRQRLDRPYVIGKSAATLDGFVAAQDGTSKWITGPQARSWSHLVRSQVGAILVGTGTVFADDPGLDARTTSGEKYGTQPAIYVAGNRQISPGAKLHQHPRGFTQLKSHDPTELLGQAKADGHTTVLVEGGPTLLSAFLSADLIDEYHVFLAPRLLGSGLRAVQDLNLQTLAAARSGWFAPPLQIGEDLLLRWHRHRPDLLQGA